MAKPKIIREWIELSEGYLEPKEGDAKRGREAMLFVNRCQLRETAKGLLLIRSTGIEEINARNAEELSEKIAAFATREDVRRLAKGIESNDFHTLPREQRNPPQDIIDGTADVYMTAEDSDD